MASSATKDTSLGESVQVRQKARIGSWRRRRRFKFKSVKAVTKVVKGVMAKTAATAAKAVKSVQVHTGGWRRRRRGHVQTGGGFKAVSKSVKHMAKNFSKEIKKVNSMAQEAAQK